MFRQGIPFGDLTVLSHSFAIRPQNYLLMVDLALFLSIKVDLGPIYIYVILHKKLKKVIKPSRLGPPELSICQNDRFFERNPTATTRMPKSRKFNTF